MVLLVLLLVSATAAAAAAQVKLLAKAFLTILRAPVLRTELANQV